MSQLLSITLHTDMSFVGRWGGNVSSGSNQSDSRVFKGSSRLCSAEPATLCVGIQPSTKKIFIVLQEFYSLKIMKVVKEENVRTKLDLISNFI